MTIRSNSFNFILIYSLIIQETDNPFDKCLIKYAGIISLQTGQLELYLFQLIAKVPKDHSG